MTSRPLPEATYREIEARMPIACVDLIIENRSGEILLVKRKNEPAKGQWWFPGGRVLHSETRKMAATRKLFEEVGLHPSSDLMEHGTYDLIYPAKHAVSTVFHVIAEGAVRLDDQSSEHAWRRPQSWLPLLKDPWITDRLMAEEFLNRVLPGRRR